MAASIALPICSWSWPSTDCTCQPYAITFQGGLDQDDLALAVADAFQRATDFHTKRPPL